jgi:hypothetical protein
MNEVVNELLSTAPALAWLIGAAMVTYPLAAAALRPPTQKVPRRSKEGNH